MTELVIYLTSHKVLVLLLFIFGLCFFFFIMFVPFFGGIFVVVCGAALRKIIFLAIKSKRR